MSAEIEKCLIFVDLVFFLSSVRPNLLYENRNQVGVSNREQGYWCRYYLHTTKSNFVLGARDIFNKS